MSSAEVRLLALSLIQNSLNTRFARLWFFLLIVSFSAKRFSSAQLSGKMFEHPSFEMAYCGLPHGLSAQVSSLYHYCEEVSVSEILILKCSAKLKFGFHYKSHNRQNCQT